MLPDPSPPAAPLSRRLVLLAATVAVASLLQAALAWAVEREAGRLDLVLHPAVPMYGPLARGFLAAVLGAGAFALWEGCRSEPAVDPWAVVAATLLVLGLQAGLLASHRIATADPGSGERAALLAPAFYFLAIAFATGSVGGLRALFGRSARRGRLLACCAILMAPAWGWMLHATLIGTAANGEASASAGGEDAAIDEPRSPRPVDR